MLLVCMGHIIPPTSRRVQCDSPCYSDNKANHPEHSKRSLCKARRRTSLFSMKMNVQCTSCCSRSAALQNTVTLFLEACKSKPQYTIVVSMFPFHYPNITPRLPVYQGIYWGLIHETKDCLQDNDATVGLPAIDLLVLLKLTPRNKNSRL